MSFWNFLGELALLEWLFGSSKHDEVKTPPSNHLYGRMIILTEFTHWEIASMSWNVSRANAIYYMTSCKIE